MAKTYTAPYCLAMIISDSIYQCPATGKKSILGMFTALQVHNFPVIWPMLAIYIALTDGHGAVPIQFRIVDADEENTVFQTQPTVVNFTDPRAIIESILVVQNAMFPIAGEYRLQVRAEEETPIMERRLLLMQIGQPPAE